MNYIAKMSLAVAFMGNFVGCSTHKNDMGMSGRADVSKYMSESTKDHEYYACEKVTTTTTTGGGWGGERTTTTTESVKTCDKDDCPVKKHGFGK